MKRPQRRRLFSFEACGGMEWGPCCAQESQPTLIGGVCALAMKHSNKSLLYGCGLLVLAHIVNANAAPDSVAAIARRNAFRLIPPKPEVIAVVQQVERPRITIQGVTTILGRPQVLLSIQQPAKPTDAPVGSWILAEGESRHEVVILQIDVASGTVRLRNNGEEQTLTLKR